VKGKSAFSTENKIYRAFSAHKQFILNSFSLSRENKFSEEKVEFFLQHSNSTLPTPDQLGLGIASDTQ
jgi:hypothetical protein